MFTALVRVLCLTGASFLLLGAAARPAQDSAACEQFRAPAAQPRTYLPLYAICLANNDADDRAGREFAKGLSANTRLTQDNAVQASIYSSVLARTAGLAQARPWWRRILAIYYPPDAIDEPAIAPGQGDYATTLALNEKFKAALLAFAEFARTTIVGMRYEWPYDDDRTISDEIVRALEGGGSGNFAACYAKLADMRDDRWNQYRSFYAGVCAQAAGEPTAALQSWLIEARQYNSGVGTEDRLIPGNTTLDAIRMLYRFSAPAALRRHG